MTRIVKDIHSRSSLLIDKLLQALRNGKLCIVDISQMHGRQSLILSALILRKIFNHNQHEFTAAEPKTIPTIAVVEEAQSVLNEKATAAEPYIAWVKEGRKYDLGALLITQQPGSIPVDILSQGDNWFIFHLLSAVDLTNVRKANAHFSEDLLSALLNEPIPGQGVFWSSVGGKPYPIALRALSFELMYQALDPQYHQPAVQTYATQLKQEYDEPLQQAIQNQILHIPEPIQPETLPITTNGQQNVAKRTNAPVQKSNNQVVTLSMFDEEDPFTNNLDTDGNPVSEPPDPLTIYRNRAIEAFLHETALHHELHSERGLLWGKLIGFLSNQFPKTFEDRQNIAHNLIPDALNTTLGPQQWYTFSGPKRDGGTTTYIKAGPKPKE